MTVDKTTSSGHRYNDVYVFRCRSMARYEIDTDADADVDVDVELESPTASSLNVDTVSIASLSILPSSKMPVKVIGWMITPDN